MRVGELNASGSEGERRPVVVWRRALYFFVPDCTELHPLEAIFAPNRTVGATESRRFTRPGRMFFEVFGILFGVVRLFCTFLDCSVQRTFCPAALLLRLVIAPLGDNP